jgi:hypothetical protein
MTEIGSARRLCGWPLLVISCACGPSAAKTPQPSDATAGEAAPGEAGGLGGDFDEPVAPADHDIEVPPAP